MIAAPITATIYDCYKIDNVFFPLALALGNLRLPHHRRSLALEVQLCIHCSRGLFSSIPARNNHRTPILHSRRNQASILRTGKLKLPRIRPICRSQTLERGSGKRIPIFRDSEDREGVIASTEGVVQAVADDYMGVLGLSF